MGSACCGNKEEQLQKIPKSQIRVLWTVLLINLVMFFVELSAGLIGDSLALISDSFDMLGDAIAYGSTLYVVNLGIAAKARSAELKAWIILFSALSILVASVYRTVFIAIPEANTMLGIAAFALAANLVCLSLLFKFRKTDINMESVWLCSRNDIIANTSVLIAAGLVKATNTPWPDLIVGIALAGFFTKSALYIFSQARREMLHLKVQA